MRSFEWKADEAFCELFVRKCLGRGKHPGGPSHFVKGIGTGSPFFGFNPANHSDELG